MFSLRSLFNSFKGFAEFHETVADLEVCGLIKPGLSWVKAFETHVNDLLDYHGVVFGFKESVNILEFVWVVVHFLCSNSKIIRFICDPLLKNISFNLNSFYTSEIHQEFSIFIYTKVIFMNEILLINDSAKF